MVRRPDREARGPEAAGGAARHELSERRANGARVTGERAPRGFDPARKADSRPIVIDGQDRPAADGPCCVAGPRCHEQAAGRQARALESCRAELGAREECGPWVIFATRLQAQ